MVAYDHYIDFIPRLESKKNRAGTFSHILTVKKGPSFNLQEKMPFGKKFINNQGRESSLYTQRGFSSTKKGQFWCYEVEEVVSFYWESGTKVLQYIPDEKFTSRLLEYWTLQIALPLFFTIEETYDFLHAGAVEINEKPVLFTAESFGGKSTLTDFFIQQGHSLLSDDRVGCYEHENLFWAVPSHPHHRPYRMMEDLGYFVKNMMKEPRPIHAIYELVRSNAKADITISQLYGVEKFVSLRYSSDINISFLKAKRFAFLSHLAQVTPIFKIAVPWDKKRLPEVYRKIVEHCNSIDQVSKNHDF